MLEYRKFPEKQGGLLLMSFRRIVCSSMGDHQKRMASPLLLKHSHDAAASAHANLPRAQPGTLDHVRDPNCSRCVGGDGGFNVLPAVYLLAINL